ncbi:MAG TPA: hypothetical protein PKD96_01140 [Candidatus Absconditabacterales bacterium]|nr:hypothetical protein [Candidatus Absconditabacterales bacterium]HMT26885.1 hypothetical protein [Candidatus Absconditabacterales bacterium]
MRAYVFDIDKNLWHTNTPVMMEEKQSDGSWQEIAMSQEDYLSLKDFRSIRHIENNIEKSMINFKDNGPFGTEKFANDIYEAVSNQSNGPSFEKFVEAVRHGNPIAIITARGHQEETLRNAFASVIAEVLECNNTKFHEQMAQILGKDISFQTALAQYIDLSRFYAISNNHFMAQYPDSSSSFRKTQAMEEYLHYVLDELKFLYQADKISVGFSDDDEKNITRMISFFEEKAQEEKFKNTHLVVYHTLPEGIKKIKITEKI